MGKGAVLDATERVRRATPPLRRFPVVAAGGGRPRSRSNPPSQSSARLRTKQKDTLRFRDVLPVFFGFGSELFCNASISDKV